jgi:hypothetical protein
LLIPYTLTRNIENLLRAIFSSLRVR